MSSSVEQIKERLDIVSVVGSYVKLEKAGQNYKAKCPFHNEKTASFFVSPARNSYHCFGCNVGGDIFSFVEQFEGQDFIGALKILAARAGVELKRENPKTKNERDRLYKTLESAKDFFVRTLQTNVSAKSYIAKRGIKEATAKEWDLGFAPNEWRALYDELLKTGFTADEMIKAGLVKRNENGDGYYDIFRGRIMFPIFDSSGRTVGFSGRILPELDDGKMGKYINSPETVLFDKSSVLYGLNKAKFDIKKRDYSIMVEGQMDLILSHQAGFTNTVAVSGTALSGDTEKHQTTTNLGLLTRLSNNIILSFDSDEAGFEASRKNAKIALTLGMDVKVAKMPEGEDPAEIIQRNSDEWKQIIKNSVNVIDFALDTLVQKKLPSRQLGKEIGLVVLPYIASLKSSIDQAHFIKKASAIVGVNEEALWEELKKAPAEDIADSRNENNLPDGKFSGSEKMGRQNLIERKIMTILYWQDGLSSPNINPKELREKIASILGEENFKKLEKELTEKKSDLIFEAEVLYEKATNISGEIDELLLNLEEERLKELLSDNLRKL